MENIIKVSMFESAQSRYASGVVNLWDWLFLEDYRTVLIKELRNESDSMKRRELKELLPAITVSCVCSERRTEKIYEYTNLICIDIDGKDNPSISNIEDLKIKLGELPYIMYCGLSASGKGLFCIIPYKDYRNHKLHFNALEQEFKDMGIVVDSSCSDIGRLRFYSYDEYPYANPDAEIYTRTLEKVPEIKQSRFHQKTDIVHNSNQTLQNIDKNTILEHFPNICERCREEGYDVTKEWIPVVPAQHYFMGGIWVDSDSRTSMEHLYAVGETSCNGVHGANRLASNSLLESLVFAKRAAHKISGVENAVNPVLFCKEVI